MVRRLIFSLLAVCSLWGAGFAEEPAALPEVTFFFSSSCHICHEIRETVLSGLEQRYRGRVVFSYYDIGDIENFKRLVALKERYNHPEGSVPMVFFNGRLLSGKTEIAEQLPALVEQGLQNAAAARHGPGRVDLAKLFLSFTPLAVAGAGLIDGINPCAFTVIVFFISFLALQGYRRPELVAIGLFFIFAVFATYLAIGLGLFSFLYSMSGFWVVRTGVNLAVGILTVILGLLAVHDAVVFKRTGNTDRTRLQLPRAVKDQIHRVIGMHYRKGSEADSTARGSLARLAVTALATGCIVSVLEALCTGQVYVPTISFVLKTTPVKARAWAFLVLYNLAFIVPLAAIFLAALFGVTSKDFAAFFKRHFLAAKVALAGVFLSLGIFLIWRG